LIWRRNENESLSQNGDDESINAYICDSKIDGDVDKIVEAIADKLLNQDVAAAVQLARNCASFGSLIDVFIIAPVYQVITDEIEPKLSPKQKEVMKELLKNCEERGEQSGGTLGRSETAHCSLKVVEGFRAGLMNK